MSQIQKKIADGKLIRMTFLKRNVIKLWRAGIQKKKEENRILEDKLVSLAQKHYTKKLKA